MPRDRSFSPLFTLIAIIAVVAALYVAKQILLPIALAILLSFLLTPLANRFERWGLPRVPAIIFVVLITFAAFGALGWIVTDQLVALRFELPMHRAKIVEKTQALREFAKRFERIGGDIIPADGEKEDAGNQDQRKALTTADPNPPSAAKPAKEPLAAPSTDGTAESTVAQFAETGTITTEPDAQDKIVDVRVVEMPPSPLTQAQTWLGPLLAPFTAAGMVFVLVFFMLLDRENQRNRFIQLFGSSNLHTTTEALTDAGHRVGRLLRMQFLINAGYGVAVAIGLSLIGVPSALMWGVLGFSLRFLPYLGPWLAAILPMLISLAVSDGWTQPILVGCMYAVYELILNNVFEPLLYGSSMGVSTVGVILSAIFWTWLWGPVGLIVAMPMTVCLVVVAQHVPQLRFITVLLADQPPLSPAQRVYQRLLAFDYHEPLKLARHYLKTSPLVKFYDEIVIPALTLFEQDRHAGQLRENEEAFVHESAEELVDELGEMVFAAQAMGTSEDEPANNKRIPEENSTPARILCVPLRDKADETAARMLTQLLTTEGFQVHAESAEALTSEVVDRVAATDSDLVVISVLPPIRPRESRLLWRRLRNRYPDLPILVGYWIGENANESLVPPAGDLNSKVATTLAEAVALIRNATAKVQLTKNGQVELPT